MNFENFFVLFLFVDIEFWDDDVFSLHPLLARQMAAADPTQATAPTAEAAAADPNQLAALSVWLLRGFVVKFGSYSNLISDAALLSTMDIKGVLCTLLSC